MTSGSILLAILALISSAMANWAIGSGEIAVSTKNGKIFNHSFNSSLETIVGGVEIPENASIDIEFSILEDGSPKRPHQAIALLRDPANDREASYVVSVNLRGRARVSIASKSVPPSLKLSGDSLELALIIGSFDQPDKKTVDEDEDPVVQANKIAGTPLYFPLVAKLLFHSTEEFEPQARLRPLPELFHTFRPQPKTNPAFLTLIFSGASVFLLFNLLVFWGLIGANVNSLGKAIGSAPLGHLGLLGSLISIEVVFVKYFLGTSIFDTIKAIALIGPLAVYFGSRALRELRVRRLNE